MQEAFFDFISQFGYLAVSALILFENVFPPISIPAGTARMNMVRFALYTLVGSLVWNAILCTLGFWAGGAWEQITAQAEWVSDIVKIAFALIAVGVVVWWVKLRIIPARREAAGK